MNGISDLKPVSVHSGSLIKGIELSNQGNDVATMTVDNYLELKEMQNGFVETLFC